MPAVRSFRVAIFRWNADPATDEPEWRASGTDDWERAAEAHPPGFETTCSIDLRPVWQEVLGKALRHYDGTATSYESFVKFGQVMEQRQSFRVVIDVDYA
jgi:hypothetical protein